MLLFTLYKIIYIVSYLLMYV